MLNADKMIVAGAEIAKLTAFCQVVRSWIQPVQKNNLVQGHTPSLPAPTVDRQGYKSFAKRTGGFVRLMPFRARCAKS